MIVCPAETAELIEMSYGMWTQVGPRNHVLDGIQIPRCRRAIFRRRAVLYKVYGLSAVSCAKTAEPIKMPFGESTRVAQGTRWGHIGTTWRIRLNCPCAAAMQPFCQITLTTRCF